MGDPVYRDSSRSVEDRVEDLLGRMTLAEKVAQLTSVWLTYDPARGRVAPSDFAGMFGRGFDLDDALRHGIGQITRPFGTAPISAADGVRFVNDLQRRLVEQTRLGIPAMCHEEALSGLMCRGATSFPSPLNYAATWDPDLIRRVGDVIRRQARSIGEHQVLAPVADVARDPRWGRIEETLGEDPYLVGRLVTAYVEGMQGEDLHTGVVATLKHFAGYSASEGGRNFAPVHIGTRELTDVFLAPFEMAVREGGALGVMHAYTELDGVPCAANRWLLTDVLRDRWGFEGIVVADYGGVGFLYLMHGVAEAAADASALALRAGVDVELPTPADFPTGVPAAIERGLLDVDDVDRAVRRVLRLKVRLGLFERPYVDPAGISLDTPSDRALAAEVARRSITLLANDGTLPLGAAGLGRIAVLGPNAHVVEALFGNYSFENHLVFTHFPELAAEAVGHVPTVVEAVEARLGSGAHVIHELGCPVTGGDRSGFAIAVAAAELADVAVVVVGDKAGHFKMGTVGEGTDTADLGLPGHQAALVEAVLDTGTPTIVVLLNGRPFSLGVVAERAAAVLEAWFPGQAGATAIAEVLFGDVNPAGRTAVTFSTGAGVQPFSYAHKGLAVGMPRLDGIDPVFPFGHGLSYTSFGYGDLVVRDATADGPPGEATTDGVPVPVDGVVGVSCTVTNTGTRAGDEVVQLYLRDPVASVTRPVQELRGFVRLGLEPGEEASVVFEVPADLCAFTDVGGRRVVEPGVIEVLVGASSADIRLRGLIRLVGETRVLGSDSRLSSAVRVERLDARRGP
ncbi:MAG: glycoside hydrolase family 3 C-terminal domain-containing protein [Acidimicrobiales bacterium]|jgi:beta-glucosidase|nr:glycoside hydrolase family 3 C-terminal domain-containing protein [Acidimicrobiales bacterium]